MQRTGCSNQLLKSGWLVTITNGAECAPMALMSVFVPAMLPIGKNFEKWAETVPQTLRNPLYHWTHLELKKFFGINEVLSPKNARQIFDACNEKLNTPAYSCRNIIRMANVYTICTTDDPIDNLQYHQQIKASGFEVAVLPAWRPDKAMMVDDPTVYNAYIFQLAAAAEMDISSFADLITALDKRHQYFHDNGCRLSDHGLDTAFAEDYSSKEIRAIFTKVRAGNHLDFRRDFEIQIMHVV